MICESLLMRALDLEECLYCIHSPLQISHLPAVESHSHLLEKVIVGSFYFLYRNSLKLLYYWQSHSQQHILFLQLLLGTLFACPAQAVPSEKDFQGIVGAAIVAKQQMRLRVLFWVEWI
uniref:Uncharacterized protein n=1 Tax=Pyxicephalus adspersus TaxID=30357 RepID=A0AAV2ZP79_PYXAD|nr:TPA: hypothetical protein GDO54_005293 [Pyxicephalus adspersus]